MTTKTKSNSKAELSKLLHKFNFNLEISLNIPIESLLIGEKTESTFIEEYNFVVTCVEKSDNDLCKRQAAKGSFRIFNAELANSHEMNASSIFDSSNESASVYTIFYEYGTFDFSDEILRLNDIDEFFVRGFNLAYLDRLELESEFIGKGFGAVILECLCGWLDSKVALVAFKSFPLQYECLSGDGPERDIAQLKLDRHYEKIGFSKFVLPEDYLGSEYSFFVYNPATHRIKV